jgi:ABC-type nickel/cobalt efflux system permease component RcnA
VRLVAYGLLVLVGFWMLRGAVRRGMRRATTGHAAEHGCGHAHAHDGEISLLALGVGLVPCTGSLMVMLFAMANGMLALGLAVVAAIGSGMALTMAGLGLASVLARGYVAERLSGPAAATALEVGGALVVLALGVTLWLGA